MKARVISFTAMMGALGNVLSLISIVLTKAGQVGLDLSHIATFVAAIYGGPYTGFLAGLIGGFAAGIWFGPLSGLGLLGLIGLPLGKALTGLTTGFLYRRLKVNQRAHASLFTIPVVLLGFIPECLFTIVFFTVLVPYVFGWISIPLLITILVKAWIEITVMSILMGALTGNSGFRTFMNNFLAVRKE